MTIEQFIDFIIDLADEDLYEKLSGMATWYFMNGGCYEFAKILKEYLPDAKFVINKDLDHCAVLYKGQIYDSNGKVLKPEEFNIATEEDIDYMEDRFGIKEAENINGKKISDILIDLIKECNIIDKLKLDQKDDEMER